MSFETFSQTKKELNRKLDLIEKSNQELLLEVKSLGQQIHDINNLVVALKAGNDNLLLLLNSKTPNVPEPKPTTGQVAQPDNTKPETQATSPAKSSTGATGNGKTIMTGPRGGQYYINSSGKKTYIKRK
jgi:colicin import membrane protein